MIGINKYKIEACKHITPVEGSFHTLSHLAKRHNTVWETNWNCVKYCFFNFLLFLYLTYYYAGIEDGRFSTA